MGNDPAGPVANGLMQMLTGGPIGAAVNAGVRSVVRRGQGINPATSDALANRLFTTDPVERQAIIAALRQRQVDDMARAARVNAMAPSFFRGVGAGAGLGAE